MTEYNVHKMPQSSYEERRQKKRKKRARRRITVISILIAGAAIGILFTPLFNLNEVVIGGNERLTYEEIVKKGGIINGKNLFTISLKKTGESISKIPYVNSIEVRRKLPDKLVINITESIPMAYIKIKDAYGVIDKNGKALEKVSAANIYNIPELLDITSKKFTLSEKISANDEEKFKKTLEILRDLYNNNFIDKIKSVSVSEDMIILKVSDKLIIEMGRYEQFNSKIVMVKEIVATLNENDFGTIDASNADRVYFDRTMPEDAQPEGEEATEIEEEAPLAENKPVSQPAFSDSPVEDIYN